MKCFGRTDRSFGKSTREEIPNDKISQEFFLEPKTSRAQSRKAKLTSNTDSGLYSDESGPEDKRITVGGDEKQLAVNHSPSFSSNNRASSNKDNSRDGGEAKPARLSRLQSSDSWYEPSSPFIYNHRTINNSVETVIKTPKVKDKKTKESPKHQKSFKNLTKNLTSKNCPRVDLDSDSSAKVYQDSTAINRSDHESSKTPIVKINKKAFDRLNSEYLSEYDSEEEMEKTLAECIARAETKNARSNETANRSIGSLPKLNGDDDEAKSNEVADDKNNECQETVYSEVLKHKDTKKIILDCEPINELNIEGSNYQCHMLRQETLQNLHALLDHVNIFMCRDKKARRLHQISSMKDLCGSLAANLSSFEKLAARAIQSDRADAESKKSIDASVKSLQVIKRHINNHGNLLGSITDDKFFDQSSSASVVAILTYTKNIPDLIRSLDYLISKKEESKPVEVARKNNHALISFNHDEDVTERKIIYPKILPKPKNLDLVQNINDNHIYDEVAMEPDSPNSKALLSELNFMISELISSTPIKNLKSASNLDEEANTVTETVSKTKDTNKTDLDYSIIKADESIKSDSEAEIKKRNKFPAFQTLPISRNKNGAAIKTNDFWRVEKAAKDQEINASTASLHDLEIKFENMLNMLSDSRNALSSSCCDSDSKQIYKSLNSLQPFDPSKQPLDNTVNIKSTSSSQQLKSVDLKNQSKNSFSNVKSNIIENSIVEKPLDRKLNNISPKVNYLFNETKSNDIQDVNWHIKIIENLKTKLESKIINQFDDRPVSTSYTTKEFDMDETPQPPTLQPLHQRNLNVPSQINSYSTEITEHWAVLIKMSEAFFNYVDQLNQSNSSDQVSGKEGLAVLMSYVKLVMQAGQKIVVVADSLLGATSDEVLTNIVEVASDSLCRALKEVVQRTKDAANRFPSIPYLQSLVDAVKILTDRAAEMRSQFNALNKVSSH